MINRSIHTIFEPSGMAIPSEEEVQFEAREIVKRSGWGMPLLEVLRKVTNPYWGEALTRCIMNKWNELVRDKDEVTYYYDMDGDTRDCWADAASDFRQIIRFYTAAQVEYEQTLPPVAPIAMPTKSYAPKQRPIQIFIQQNTGPIITDSNVSLYQP